MSTRSNIIVISPSKEIKQYYRHWDGYFEGTGLDLISKLNDAFNDRSCAKYIRLDKLDEILGDYKPQPKTFYDWFMFHMSKDLRVDGKYENDYEPEDDLILHGDIEYLYIIDFSSEVKAESARLFYRSLGIGNEFIKTHNRSDLDAIYRYVVDGGKNPVEFTV
jgi:hypothetical protein